MAGKAKAQKQVGSWTDDPDRLVKNGLHLEAMGQAASKPSTGGKRIELPQLDIRQVTVKIVGDSDLIVHHWSQKAIRQMLDKQMDIPTAGREPKDPERDFLESQYPMPGGGHGFPSIAFKSAAVEACTSSGKAISKVQARQAFHVIGEFVRIECEGGPIMREDMVRVGQGTADIRYRASYKNWSCLLTVRYNARVLSNAQIVNLLNMAGFGVGVGEWRSEKDGSFGLFHVANQND